MGGKETTRRTLLLSVIGVVAVLAFSSIASAHILTFKRARAAAFTEAKQECNSFSTCTQYGAGNCKRLSPHRIRCIAFVRDTAGGECRWPVTSRIERGTGRLVVRSNPDETAVCRP